MEPTRIASTKEQQNKLQENCRHPDGTWIPFDWAAPKVTFPERVAQLAEAHPDRIALIDHETSMTFSELDQAANAVAAAILEALGSGQEPVALLVGLDAPAIIAALGIMRAGKFFVSLEETYPAYRHQQILEDTGARLILMDDQNKSQAENLASPEHFLIQLESLSTSAPPPRIAPPSLDDLALINYTSGTTGKPKGVVQSHRSALALAVRFMSYYRPSDADITATFQYLAWAGLYWTFIGALTLGSPLAVFDVRQHGDNNMIKWIHRVKPTIFVGRVFLREIAKTFPNESFPDIRLIATGGDTIFQADVKAGKRNFPNAITCVGLGISEAGMTTQIFIDGSARIEEKVIPLGFPVDGVNIRLISETGAEVRKGEAGEIVVESPYLAEGYWNKPGLTSEKFQPLADAPGTRAYHTGDLGMLRDDGMLQHMGRAHDMIKIRGLQVFPKKIEALLRGTPGVTSVCVTGYAPPEKPVMLVGYLVVDHDVFPGVDAALENLSDLPNHMKPQSWVFIDEMPITSTGKIDRKRLPAPEISRQNVTADYAAPRTPIEKVLTQIWGEILGIEGIGVHDNFFELGGDSLSFTRIISKIREILDVNLTFNDAMNAVTVTELAEIIEKLDLP